MSIEQSNRSFPLLSVERLSLRSSRFEHQEEILSEVSFSIDSGRCVGLVGESGSGKTMCALAILDILPAEIKKTGGSVRFQGKVVTPDSEPSFISLRGKEIAMIFQDVAAALNPVFKVGSQINDVIRSHFSVDKGEAKERTLKLLDAVGLPDAPKIYHRYPHELSGGMAQRVMIAMALSCQPKLIIADEPTTALDVITQLQIMQLIRSLQQQSNFGLLLITHDIHLVADVVEEVYILHRGNIIESGSVKSLRQYPQHSYTRLLFDAGLQGWRKQSDLSKIGEQ